MHAPGVQEFDLIIRPGVVTRYSRKRCQGRVQVRGRKYTFSLTSFRGCFPKELPKIGQAVVCVFRRTENYIVCVRRMNQAAKSKR